MIPIASYGKCNPIWRTAIASIVGFVISLPSQAEQARVAVAANFATPAREIAEKFEADTGHQIKLSLGSTGQLYAQILHGAPFDLYLAADQKRPARTIRNTLAISGSQFTYATGRLILYSRQSDLVAGEDSLSDPQLGRLAIANPATAPYGEAAMAVLQNLGHQQRLAAKIVQGTNIAQTYQFVFSGSADMGFVALSQVIGRTEGSRWLVPENLHAPIAQDAVLLTRGQKNQAAQAFLTYLKSAKAAAIIRRHGYGIPDHKAGD